MKALLKGLSICQPGRLSMLCKSMSADGFLMPVKKGQAPPDLRYFK
jgi:hypothetical protein